MPPRRKVEVGTKGTPQKKATRTSSRKASSTNDEKKKTDDATKSSVPPGAIPYNPNDDADEYDNVADLATKVLSSKKRRGMVNKLLYNVYDDDE